MTNETDLLPELAQAKRKGKRAAIIAHTSFALLLLSIALLLPTWVQFILFAVGSWAFLNKDREQGVAETLEQHRTAIVWHRHATGYYDTPDD